ncbi:MAG: CPBP family intramembrane glutamic endopeptidase [Caldilineaceae bacterium]
MSADTLAVPKSFQAKSGPWWEIVVILGLYLFVTLFVKGLAPLAPFLLLIYILTDGWLRHRTWADYGFARRSIPDGIRNTLGWSLLVVFGTQAIFVFGEYFFLPDVFQHIFARLPVDMRAMNASVVITLVIGTFLEELIFRALFQNRLAILVSPATAISITALTFALAHYSPGPVLVVFVDLLSVFIDGLLYGVIYQRSKNIFVSWIPHFLADVVAQFFF